MGMNGVWHLAGWKWIFLLEGAPILLGIIAICYLTDKPQDAFWLAPKEKQWLETHLEQEGKTLGKYTREISCRPFAIHTCYCLVWRISQCAAGWLDSLISLQTRLRAIIPPSWGS